MFQLYKPNYFFSSSIIIVGTSFTVARVLILLAIAGMTVFSISVYRGNLKGRLHISYFIMIIYSVFMILFSTAPMQFKATLENDKIELNALVYLITTIFAIIVFTLFILREKGGISSIPKMSSLMLLVIVGQFVTNGVFVNSGSIISHPRELVYGVISVLPYLTIFLFEYFILEPTMSPYNNI